MSNYTLGCINVVSKVIWIGLKLNMQTTANMCIPRASLTFVHVHPWYLPSHSCNRCAGGSDTAGVRGSELGGGAQGAGNRRSSHRGGVARVPWPPSILFPERQAPEHMKPPMFLQIHWVSFILDDALSIGIGWNPLLYFISFLVQISHWNPI